MLRLFINAFVVLLCIVTSCSYASSKDFFPDAIKSDMIEDLDGFLEKLPINQGQKVLIEKVMQYPEYKNILLFIDSDFSYEKIERLSRLKKPYLLIETLDILSVNLDMHEVFSNYFFKNLMELSKKNKETYMISLFRFCKKSDGFYAELFFDPLVDILQKDPDSFFNSINKSKSFYEICEILKTGDRRHVIDILHKIVASNMLRVSFGADKMLDCLEEK